MSEFEVDPSPDVQSVAVEATSSSGLLECVTKPPIAIFRYRATGSSLDNWSMPTPFNAGADDSAVRVGTACGLYSGPVSPSLDLWKVDTTKAIYYFDPNEAPSLRVPMRSLEVPFLEAVDIAGVDHEFVNGRVRDVFDPCEGGIGPCTGVQGDSVTYAHAHFERIIEGYATDMAPQWPSEVGCGSETPLQVIGTRGFSSPSLLPPGEGYVFPESEVNFWRTSGAGMIRTSAGEGTVKRAAYREARRGDVIFVAPPCGRYTRPLRVTISVRMMDGPPYPAAFRQSFWVRPTPGLPVDVLVDSDNDGDIDAADDAFENDLENLPALVELNDDDDDGNGVPDYDDRGWADDDLEPFRIEAAAGEPGFVTVRLAEGMSSVRVWDDTEKTTELVLPRTVDITALPITGFVEGIGWADVVTVLEAVRLDSSGEEVARDAARLYVGPQQVSVVSEIAAGTAPNVSVTGLPPGTPVSFQIERNGSIVETISADGSGLVANALLDLSASTQSPGDVYRVRAVVDDRVVLPTSGEMVVVPGPAATLSLTAPSAAASDGERLTHIMLSATDVYGNAVRDGTVVSWDIIGGTGLTETTAETVGGQAPTSLVAGLFGGVEQSVTARIGDAEALAAVQNEIIDVALTSSVDQLRLGSSAATLTAVLRDESGAFVPDGTPVVWSATKGELSAVSGTTIGGTAQVQIRAGQGSNATSGTCIVTAASGNNVGRTNIEFLPDCLDARLQTGGGTQLHVLTGDAAFSGGTTGGYAPVDRLDGTTEPMPYWTALQGTLRGPRDAIVRITPSAAARPYVRLYSSDGTPSTAADGSIEVRTTNLGIASYVVGSTGQLAPGAGLLRANLDVTFVRDAPSGPGGDGIQAEGAEPNLFSADCDSAIDRSRGFAMGV